MALHYAPPTRIFGRAVQGMAAAFAVAVTAGVVLTTADGATIAAAIAFVVSLLAVIGFVEYSLRRLGGID